MAATSTLEGIVLFQMPKEKTALWDQTGCGRPYILHLGANQRPKVYIKEKILQLASELIESKDIGYAFCNFLGSITATGGPSSVGVSITLNVFDGSPASRFSCDTEFAVPAVVSQQVKEGSQWTTNHYFSDLKALVNHCNSMISLDLSRFLKMRMKCCYFGMHCKVNVELVTIATAFMATPILSVPIIRSALTERLLRTKSSLPESGFLVIDREKRFVVVPEIEENLPVLPIVGIWVSGVSSVRHPIVWAACVRYVGSQLYKNRLCLPPLPFLLVVYHPDVIPPTFYNCICTKENEKWPTFEVFDGQASTDLPKVPIHNSKMLVVDLITSADKCKELDEADRRIERRELPRSPSMIASNAADVPQATRKIPFKFEFEVDSHPRVKDLSITPTQSEALANLPMCAGQPHHATQNLQFGTVTSYGHPNTCLVQNFNRGTIQPYANQVIPQPWHIPDSCNESNMKNGAVTYREDYRQQPRSAYQNGLNSNRTPEFNSQMPMLKTHYLERTNVNDNIQYVNEQHMACIVPTEVYSNDHLTEGDPMPQRLRPPFQVLEKLKSIRNSNSGAVPIDYDVMSEMKGTQQKSDTFHIDKQVPSKSILKSPSQFKACDYRESAAINCENLDPDRENSLQHKQSSYVNPVKSVKVDLSGNKGNDKSPSDHASLKSGIPVLVRSKVIEQSVPSKAKPLKANHDLISKRNSPKEFSEGKTSLTSTRNKGREIIPRAAPASAKFNHKPAEKKTFNRNNNTNCKKPGGSSGQKMNALDSDKENESIDKRLQSLESVMNKVIKKMDEFYNVNEQAVQPMQNNTPIIVPTPSPRPKADGNHQVINTENRFCSIATMTSFACNIQSNGDVDRERCLNYEHVENKTYKSSNTSRNYFDERNLNLQRNATPKRAYQTNRDDTIYPVDHFVIDEMEDYEDSSLLLEPSRDRPAAYDTRINSYTSKNKPISCQQHNSNKDYIRDQNYSIHEKIYNAKGNVREMTHVNKRHIYTNGPTHFSIVQESRIVTTTKRDWANGYMSNPHCPIEGAAIKNGSNLTNYGLSDNNMSFATKKYLENYGLKCDSNVTSIQNTANSYELEGKGTPHFYTSTKMPEQSGAHWFGDKFRKVPAIPPTINEIT